MNEKVMLKREIEKYLRIPFILFIVLVVMNGAIYFIDTSSAIIISIFLVLYLLIVVLVYVHFKPNITTALLGFAFEHGKIQKELLKELAIPYAIMDIDGKLLWGNKAFHKALGGERVFRAKRNVCNIFPDITKELIPIDEEESVISLNYEDSYFMVQMKRVNFQEDFGDAEEEINENDLLIAIYLFDETELQKYIIANKEQKLVCGLLYIDNYDEALECLEDVRRSLLTALIDRKVNKYMQNIDAIVKKIEKDKFLFVFQQKSLTQLQNTKFSILDEVRTINIGNEISVTLSIGIGAEADKFDDCYDYARMAMDLALGRGGDQAVVKMGERIFYYGGKSQGIEKSTRVKARVKAHALREMLETKEKVIVMGHKLPDVDSLGAAIGIYRLAMAMNKKAHIVINEATISIRPVINNFLGNSIYGNDLFYTSDQAIEAMDNSTMLVVVDVNRPSYTECEDLLSLTKSIVVLDHHRQSNEIIDNAILSYIEPNASSACEMVAEILQYIVDSPKLRPIEADAMYAGILVDTDNFVTKTGVRTFEAASYLRKSGADVVRVRKMFRSDMDSHKLRAKCIANVEMYLDSFAISILPKEIIDSPTVEAAKVANELLGIDGVRASFVLSFVNEQVYISARSIDDVNVQIIMERLGGGGHANVAGTQLKDCTVNEAVLLVKDLLLTMTTEGDI